MVNALLLLLSFLEYYHSKEVYLPILNFGLNPQALDQHFQ